MLMVTFPRARLNTPSARRRGTTRPTLMSDRLAADVVPEGMLLTNWDAR
jgi:hypothetical protein